jgi:hypothetical protein
MIAEKARAALRASLVLQQGEPGCINIRGKVSHENVGTYVAAASAAAAAAAAAAAQSSIQSHCPCAREGHCYTNDSSA